MPGCDPPPFTENGIAMLSDVLDKDVLDFLVGQFVNVDLTGHPASGL
jgi:hypothetical protein